MTVDEIKGMSKQDMQDKLIEIYSKGASARAYLAIEDSIDKISKQIDSIDINIDADKGDKVFERILSFSEKLLKIEEGQIKRLSNLDEGVLKEEREKRNAAKSGTLEQFVKSGFMKGKEDE